MKRKKLFIALVVVLAVFTARMAFLAMSSRDMTPTLGLSGEELTYCPQKPNCVSSQEEGDHFVEPIRSELTIEEAKTRLLELPRARLEKEGDNYLHLTFKSKLFGFLDDVELAKRGDVFHIRSASRVGYSDMDSNRERVELIRTILNK